MLVEPGTRLGSARVQNTVFRRLCARDFLGIFTLQFAVGDLLDGVTWELCENTDSDIGSVLYIDVAPANSPASISIANSAFLSNSAAQVLSLPNEHLLQRLFGRPKEDLKKRSAVSNMLNMIMVRNQKPNNSFRNSHHT